MPSETQFESMMGSHSSQFRRRHPKHFKRSWPRRPLSLETPIGDGRIQPRGSSPGAMNSDAESRVSPVDRLRLLTGASKTGETAQPNSDGVLLGFLHDFAPRIRRTEVRPICNRRAISALLTLAR